MCVTFINKTKTTTTNVMTTSSHHDDLHRHVDDVNEGNLDHDVLISLPDVVLQQMIQYLNVHDIFHLISTCRSFYQLSQKESFWIGLVLDQHQQKHKHSLMSSLSSSCSTSSSSTSLTSILSTTSKNKKNDDDTDVRLQYLLAASSSQYYDMKWYQTSISSVSSSCCATTDNHHDSSRNGDHDSSRNDNRRRSFDVMFCDQESSSSIMSTTQQQQQYPTSREGHLTCRIGSYLVITGGFTADENIYIKQIPSLLTSTSTSSSSSNGNSNHNPWIMIEPTFLGTDAHNDDVKHHNEQQINNHHPSHEMMDDEDLDELHWVYGSTLTPLDDNHAIRFGGFQSGGYSMETCQVALLTLTPSATTSTSKKSRSNSIGTTTTATRINQNAAQATWKIMNCRIHNSNSSSSSSTLSSEISTRSYWWNEKAARAYHTATLLYNRYLLIIGGMQSDDTILSPILLDTHTWIWYYDNIIDMKVPLPSPRFGHSVIEDYQNTCSTTRRQQYCCNKSKQNHLGDKNDINIYKGNDTNTNTNTNTINGNANHNDLLRDVQTDNKKEAYARLLLLGGGNGSDLLRDGIDFTDIWELDLHIDRCCKNNHQSIVHDHNDNNSYNHVDETLILQKTLPWTFRCLYRDDVNGTDSGNTDNNTNDTNHENVNNSTRSNDSSLVLLSPSEKLILGRCHMSYKISNDIVILMFGSGRPSTNGIIGFHLKTNQLFRYNHIWGDIPVPRFSFGSIYLQEFGYIIIHSGYSTQLSNTIDDICILDIAPHIEQKQRHHVLEQMFQMNTTRTTRNVRSYPPVTDDVVQQQYIPHNPSGNILYSQ